MKLYVQVSLFYVRKNQSLSICSLIGWGKLELTTKDKTIAITAIIDLGYRNVLSSQNISIANFEPAVFFPMDKHLVVSLQEFLVQLDFLHSYYPKSQPHNQEQGSCLVHY